MKKIFSVMVIICMVILCTACGNENQTAQVDNQIPQKSEVEENKNKVIQAFGTVKAKQVTCISVNVPTSIDKIYVSEGQKVKKGDELVTLNLNEINSQIKSKENDLEIAKLELKKMLEENNDEKNSLQTQELIRLENKYSEEQTKIKDWNYADVQKQINDLEIAKDDLKNLQEQKEHKNKLLKQGAIAQNEYDEYLKSIKEGLNNVDNINLSLESLKESKEEDLDNLKNQVKSKKHSVKNENLDITIKEQNIKTLENEVATLKNKLKSSDIEKNKIICNMENGVVSKIHKVAGDKIESDDQIMTLYDLNSLIIDSNVAEDFIKDVRVGDKVSIKPMADNDREYTGFVSEIASLAVENNGETVVPICITIDNNDGFLLPNFNANLKITTTLE